MPIYEYQCEACGKSVEKLQKISDKPLSDCPHCHKKKTLQKLISAAGFRLSGKGWYETDFKKSKQKNLADSSSSSEASCSTNKANCGKCN